MRYARLQLTAGGRRESITIGDETVAKVRLMYWKEVPVQVQAEDAGGQVSKQLDERFQHGVDTISMFDGSSGNDEYLMAWEWGQFRDEEGSAEEVAGREVQRLNDGFPTDFVRRIRRLHSAGERDPQPGAADHWIE